MRFVGPRSAHVKYDVTDYCVWYAIDRLLKPHSRDHVGAVATLLDTFCFGILRYFFPCAIRFIPRNTAVGMYHSLSSTTA